MVRKPEDETMGCGTVDKTIEDQVNVNLIFTLLVMPGGVNRLILTTDSYSLSLFLSLCSPADWWVFSALQARQCTETTATCAPDCSNRVWLQTCTCFYEYCLFIEGDVVCEYLV